MSKSVFYTKPVRASLLGLWFQVNEVLFNCCDKLCPRGEKWLLKDKKVGKTWDLELIVMEVE